MISARFSGGAPRRATILTMTRATAKETVPLAVAIAIVVPASIPVLNLPWSKEGVDGLTHDQMRTHAGKVTAQFRRSSRVYIHQSTRTDTVSAPGTLPVAGLITTGSSALSANSTVTGAWSDQRNEYSAARSTRADTARDAISCVV